MEEKLLNASEVSLLVGCSVPTLSMWYKWRDTHANNEYAKLLPDYIREGSQERGKRLWKYSDVYKLLNLDRT